MHWTHQKPNRWKGFVLGAVGATCGLLAMQAYWSYIAPQVEERLGKDQKPKAGRHPQEDALDDISLIGKQYEGDESSTDAMGRLAYTGVTGKPPRSQEGKTILSYLVHWGYGIFQGGMYGATVGLDAGPDPLRGAIYAAGLWGIGDEMAVPMLGLQAGPTAATPVQHLNRFGAHMAYGIATGIVTGILFKFL